MTIHDVMHERLKNLHIGCPCMVYSDDRGIQADYVAALRQELMGFEHILPIFCDAAGCPQFEDWMYRASRAAANAAQKRGFQVSPWPDGPAAPSSQIDDLYIQIDDFFADLLYLNVHIFLIVEHFEQAIHWNNDMAWARYFFSGEFLKSLNDLPPQADFSSVIVADRPVDHITGSKPMSSSSFANIFVNATYRLERDKEPSL